ncbi:uncharacterized protein [Onthophagus taurus]|uniref:uncharacterized protein n=1 Tax=Onthophagus taurus TaxID=166361 RepID=UPI000C206526|nr:uncharacterized protein LOC111418979 [Onthophagus taurus]
MSPKNEVNPLSFLCLKFVSNVLIHSLCDDEGKNYKLVKNYLQDTTYEVIQDLLKVILSTENLDAATRFSCLEVLLREDVRRIDTGVFPGTYYEKILRVLTKSCGNLHHLNLKGVWVKEHTNLLCELLKKLKNLRVLIIPHIPDDNVLRTIVNCNKLSVVDISGECLFTEEGLRDLKSDSIKILHIGMYGKKEICQENDSSELIATVIKQLPNLNVFKVYSFTGAALLKIYENEPSFKTKLTYIHDTDTTLESLEAIIHLCPKLESANFNSPSSGVLNNFKNLHQLNCLKLSRPNYDDFNKYLIESGDRLQILKLNMIKDQRIDVSKICSYAPDLQTFECFKLKLSCTLPDTYFMNLQTIEILYCDITTCVLKYLLMNTPFLKRIVVGDVITITDGDVFRLCAECGFHNLEELWFSSARGLTIVSVELLMGHCQNLKVLGQLSGWNISADDMDYLRAIILSSNMDLILLPVGVFP